MPTTIDAQDGLLIQMYCGAQAKGDSNCVNFIKANFFSLLLDTTVKARAIAKEIAGREIKHILVIRANQLTCDTLAEMIAWFKGLGARFISLDEALSDPFYLTMVAGRRPIVFSEKHATHRSGRSESNRLRSRCNPMSQA